MRAGGPWPCIVQGLRLQRNKLSLSALQALRIHRLDGGFKYFLFSPLPGEMIQFDEHIFQRGWFNHQLDSNLPRIKCWLIKNVVEAYSFFRKKNNYDKNHDWSTYPLP